ncbi:AtzH-like domain-containing protein [Halomarina oriensis]|uniref:DUF3225 domain-containing protein n=1 Tax=Halomarina oriensis TaxID=671145 RepID=A0A6B0GPS7_9EURY|nr:AtzH-like domain-containing protein [Halomarina oriensis]MWG36876.1 DUF3225 domain-containing protein [Halomarina oriensis]
MTVADTIEAYYDALRSGDPLAPFFLDSPDTVKFGLSERLDGVEDVAEGLRSQTETTREWVVESSDLVTGAHGETAWFADSVFMGWTDTERSIRYEFETRWSGTLVRVDGEWRFASVHVSTTEAL